MYTPEASVPFRLAIRELQKILKKGQYRIMDFKGIYITVSEDSNEDDLAIIYDLKYKIKNSEK